MRQAEAFRRGCLHSSVYRHAYSLCAMVYILTLCTIAPAVAQHRTALVIGNAAYEVGPLRNPINDASDMAAALQQFGFKVTLLRDIDLRTMREAVDTFGLQLRQGGVGLFYFAGHGAQVNGENYLLPLRANITRGARCALRSHASWTYPGRYGGRETSSISSFSMPVGTIRMHASGVPVNVAWWLYRRHVARSLPMPPRLGLRRLMAAEQWSLHFLSPEVFAHPWAQRGAPVQEGARRGRQGHPQ